MADKEAVVYIIDLGVSMGDCHNGRTESDLDWAMRYVWDKISTTVAASRKTWNVGVIGIKTDETRNSMQNEEGYSNISVLQELGPMTMTSLEALRDQVKPSESDLSSTDDGDPMSGIILAVDMIAVLTKKLKYKRQVYLITDGNGIITTEGLDDLNDKINADGVELIVLGVDFDDADYGFKEEDKPSLKRQNEKILRNFVDKCDNGTFGTIAEAIAELDTPRLKAGRPYKPYDGTLTLGLANPPEDLKIPPTPFVVNVERYFRTKTAAAPTASTVIVAGSGGGDDDDEESQARPAQPAPRPEPMDVDEDETAGFADVKHVRTYRINDPGEPGGKRDVDFDKLAKGYAYGRTAVPISESEWNITKLETAKSFTIIGFIPSEKYESFLNMGESCLTAARKFDEKSQLALSSLIHALFELESYAIARIVAKDQKEPMLVLLAPHIEPDMECLYDVPLPFAEDVRAYQFPPLDTVITVTGQKITKNHRLLPSDKLTEAMSDYVDAMDLSTFGKDDDGEPTEYAAIEDTFNPVIHRLNQAIRQRAVRPESQIDPIPPVLVRYAAPPEGLVEKSKSEIESLIKIAEVKKVPPKAKGKRTRREQVKPISGLDIDALLGPSSAKRPRISAQNAIPEFKRALDTSTDLSHVGQAAEEMGEIIRSLVTDSFGDANYARAAENLGVMREGLVEFEEPQVYNDFIRDLKKKILSGELGGDRREMWWRVRTSRLGLIDVGTSEVSSVSKEEANEFLKSK
ncbi:ATP-dependent DNA helicase II subunit 2 [Colletotrichum spinosum]|uniref:ATP-dependent DNA helicase II subunit 2 n=1 Tax=Colletotrichum spinosum TaxID=1347390 RepID=A0A4R8Q1E3_9PEZI|nr:ATP-dependent DNA helicase II subunit 2 [Colletotrichum spinosum]